MNSSHLKSSYVKKHYKNVEYLFSQLKWTIEQNAYDSINVKNILCNNRQLINQNFGQDNTILHFLLKHYDYKNYKIFDYIICFLIDNFSDFREIYNSLNMDGKKAIEVSKSNKNLDQFFKILNEKYREKFVKHVWSRCKNPIFYTFYNY